MTEESDKLNRIADANRIAALEATPYDFGACVRQVLEIDRLRAKLAEVERQRDLALEGEREKACRVAELEAALLECSQSLDGDGKACWCCIPSMIPYRGHDAGCEAARTALSQPREPTPSHAATTTVWYPGTDATMDLCPEHAIRLPCPACATREEP